MKSMIVVITPGYLTPWRYHRRTEKTISTEIDSAIDLLLKYVDHTKFNNFCLKITNLKYFFQRKDVELPKISAWSKLTNLPTSSRFIISSSPLLVQLSLTSWSRMSFVTKDISLCVCSNRRIACSRESVKYETWRFWLYRGQS